MKYTAVLLIVLLLGTLAYPQHKRKKHKRPKHRRTVVLPVSSSPAIPFSHVDSLISFAKLYIGTPYRHGGMGPRAFDCAGFTQFVFKHFSLPIPRTPAGQAGLGKFIERPDIQKGDILFFTGRNSRSKRIGHVGLVIHAEAGVVRMIHAASKGITIDNLDSLFYYRKRYLGARRIL